jgi:BlaI family penicillinase repressor
MEAIMTKKKYELTEGEWAIVRAVWDNEPCAAPTVQEVLQGRKGWSYSTVKTMMDRMVAKGLLKTERIRNLILYRSAITKKEAQKGEVMRAVKRAFDGALTPMMQFLLDNNSLSKSELRELEKLIKSKKGKACPERSRGVKSKKATKSY